MSSSFHPYSVKISGAKADPYRIATAYRITHPAIFHALKKLLRMGRTHKTAAKDVAEAIASLRRWQEMQAEDAKPTKRSR